MVDAVTPLEQTKELIQMLLLRLCLREDDLSAPNFPVKSEPGEDDLDGVEYFLEELEIMMDSIDEGIENWLGKRISNYDFLKLEFLLEDTISASDDVVIEGEAYRTRYESLVRSVQKSFAWMRSQSENDVRKDYYVYFHRDDEGNVFYVGKGTVRRAWSEDRHAIWLKYVNERLDGNYSVDIFKEGLTEIEAEELEEQKIEEYGEQLVNWINPGRNFDYQALSEYHSKRNANRLFVEETKRIEAKDLTSAIERYFIALNRMREYESLTLETGLVAELGGGPDWGDPNILNRLTICLQKQNRYSEMIDHAQRYFSEFPSARGMSTGKQIVKRIEKVQNILEKQRT